MTFSDIFKSSFLENVEEFAPLDMVIALALALALGLYICLIYKKTFSGVMYSRSFAISLMGLTLITTLVILAVTSNVVLSLGMVGALSIVRFRTAIKEPLDIVFLFWAIAAGIVLGAGMIPLAVFGSVFVGLMLLIFINRKTHDAPYLLVLSCRDDDTEAACEKRVAECVKKYITKSKTVSDAGVELTYEIRLKDGATAFVNSLNALDGVSGATLVSFNGDYMA